MSDADPLTVRCPRCYMPPGEPCPTLSGWSHADRVRAVGVAPLDYIAARVASDPASNLPGPADPRCNCATFGHAALCSVHTQADFDSAEATREAAAPGCPGCSHAPCGEWHPPCSCPAPDTEAAAPRCICPPDICLGEDETAPTFCIPCHDQDPEMPCLAEAAAPQVEVARLLVASQHSADMLGEAERERDALAARLAEAEAEIAQLKTDLDEAAATRVYEGTDGVPEAAAPQDALGQVIYDVLSTSTLFDRGNRDHQRDLTARILAAIAAIT